MSATEPMGVENKGQLWHWRPRSGVRVDGGRNRGAAGLPGAGDGECPGPVGGHQGANLGTLLKVLVLARRTSALCVWFSATPQVEEPSPRKNAQVRTLPFRPLLRSIRKTIHKVPRFASMRAKPSAKCRGLYFRRGEAARETGSGDLVREAGSVKRCGRPVRQMPGQGGSVKRRGRNLQQSAEVCTPDTGGRHGGTDPRDLLDKVAR